MRHVDPYPNRYLTPNSITRNPGLTPRTRAVTVSFERIRFCVVQLIYSTYFFGVVRQMKLASVSFCAHAGLQRTVS